MNLIDNGQFGDAESDTFTREEYRRIHNGDGPAPPDPWPICAECPTRLSAAQVRRGGTFCSLRCSGTHNARIGNTKTIETPTSQPEGWDHPTTTATPGETTAASVGAAPAAEKRVPATAGNTNGEAPLRAAHLPIDPDELGLVHLAAALVDVLLAIPGGPMVEIWVGPIGPIEVRR